jgi:rfaE bifunctional protein kinase chain/domain
MNNLLLERAEEILNNLQNKKIAVIGDVMLDRYFWGNVSRVSPEAPVPVIDLEKETFHLGGAANVANNLLSLGAAPVLFGLTGNDEEGKNFIKYAHKNGLDTSGIFKDNDRKTTVKTRIIGNNQQIARLDNETKVDISMTGIQFIVQQLHSYDDLSAIIFEDYNKGTITKKLIEDVLYIAALKKIPIFVDPKEKYFFDYKNVTVFKPNKKEAATALGRELKSRDDVIEAGEIIKERTNAKNLLITLGSEGMILFDEKGNNQSVPTIARNVADVSGAGDTAIATLSAAYAGGADIYEAAALANYAAGVVCESPGIVSIQTDILLKSVKKNMNNGK